ncbi:hypothetical protein D3C87_1511910 [compost metagenome]
MEHEQVDVFAAQGFEATVHGVAHGIGLQLVPPDFGRDVDLLAGCRTVRQRLTDSVFVVVGRCRVDVPVTQGQSLLHCSGAFLAEHWPGAEAEFRHVQTLSVNDVLHGRSPFHKQ